MSNLNIINIKKFLKDKHNMILLIIILFAFIIRLKYLFVNSGLWFDETEYLAIAKGWVFDIPWNWSPVRPPLLPAISAVIFFFGGGEAILRILELLVSVGGVYATYLLGKEIYSTKVGLIAAFVLSYFYLHIFFTSRILTGVPSLTIYLFVGYLFMKWFNNKKFGKYLWFAGFLTGLGVILRFPVVLILGVIFIFLIITRGLKFLKNKDIWISFGIFLLTLAPYFWIFYNKFGKIAILSSTGSYRNSMEMLGYMKLANTYFFSPLFKPELYWPHILLLCFLLGFGMILLDLFLGYDLFKKDKTIQKHLFILIFTFIPFFYFANFIGWIEPRYMLYVFPGAFIMIGYGLITGAKFLDKKYWKLSLLAISILLLFGAYHQLSLADNMILSKSSSFSEIKPAGEWIKSNSLPEDTIVSDGAPMFTYFSERKVLPYGSEEDFLERVKRDKPKYMILYAVERSPDWAYAWPQNNQDKITPVFGYPLNSQQPLLVIYQFNKEIFEE